MKLIQLPTQAFEQRLLEEMNENPRLKPEGRGRVRKDEFETVMIMMMPMDRMEADDINIEYISSDDTRL
jgi:RNA polymerase sigma-54 factor